MPCGPCWYTPMTPVIHEVGGGQENPNVEASLGDIARLCLKVKEAGSVAQWLKIGPAFQRPWLGPIALGRKNRI